MKILSAVLIFFGCLAAYGQQQFFAQNVSTAGVTYTVTGATVANGTISCTSPVTSGSTTTCTFAPSAGYAVTAASSDTCGGSLSGLTYTTGAVTSNCIVTGTFSLAGAPPVQAGTGGATGGASSNTQPFTTGVTAGNTMVFFVENQTNTTTTISSASWSGGSCGTITATPLGVKTLSTTDSMWAYVVPITSSGCTGVVFNFSGSINSTVLFAEYANMAASPLDCEVQGNSTTTTAFTSGTCATSNADDTLVSGVLVTTSGGGALTAGTSYTTRAISAGSTHRGLEDRNVTTTGSYAGTWTYSSNQTAMVWMLALKRVN